jgi:hypothetical protein
MEFVIKRAWLLLWLAVACTAHSGLAAAELEAYRLASGVAAAKSNLIGAAIEPTNLGRDDYFAKDDFIGGELLEHRDLRPATPDSAERGL